MSVSYARKPVISLFFLHKNLRNELTFFACAIDHNDSICWLYFDAQK